LRHRLFTLRTDTHREHGCSRSFVTYRHEGTLRLDLEHHRAALELDLTLDTTFSRSRFDVANQRRNRQRWRYTWKTIPFSHSPGLTLYSSRRLHVFGQRSVLRRR
jgi:hypothetical protein